MFLDLLDRCLAAAVESGTVCIHRAFVDREVRQHFFARDHCALPLRVSLRQTLPQEQQKYGIEKRQVRDPQQHGRIQITHLGPPRERDLKIDDQFKKQLGQALANDGFVANQRRP